MPLASILRRGFTLPRCLLALCALSILMPPAASAQACWNQGALSLSFGSVGGNGGTAVSTGLETRCLPSVDGNTFYYELCYFVNPGEYSTEQGPRRMHNYNTGTYLDYDLFTDPTHTVRVGGVGAGIPVRKTLVVPPGSEAATPVEFYGLVFPGQAVPAGNYFEYGTNGVLRYRYSTAPFSASDDCLAGGIGEGQDVFHSSGISATFENACWIAATDLDFGHVEPPRNPIQQTSDIRINCAPGTVWTVGLSNGRHFDGTMRQMAGPNGYVKYQLYLDASHTHVWQDDIDQNRAAGSTDEYGNTATLTVFGEVPPQADVETGLYSDTIIATLYY